MRARGIEATAATFGSLLSLASETGAWGRVVEAWGWLQSSGLQVHVGCATTYMGALLKLVRGAGGVHARELLVGELFLVWVVTDADAVKRR